MIDGSTLPANMDHDDFDDNNKNFVHNYAWHDLLDIIAIGFIYVA